METSLLNDWISLRIVNVLVLLLVGSVFRFWKSGALSEDPFFSRQRWSVGSAVACLIAVYAMLIPFDVALTLKINTTTRFVLGLMPDLLILIIIWFFLYLFQQPYSDLGISIQDSARFVLIGLKWILCIEITLHLVLSFFPIGMLYKQIEGLGPFRGMSERYSVLWAAYYIGLSFVWLGLNSIIEEILFRGLQ